jgi:hypothetical protein
MTVDYDFWVHLPERQYVRLLTIVQRQTGTIRARTVYELADGTQVNAVFEPDGLRSFEQESRNCLPSRVAGVSVKVLPLARVIASKQAAARDKDIAVLPILKRTLRAAKRLKTRSAKASVSSRTGKQPSAKNRLRRRS